jgi:hypothetical protein
MPAASHASAFKRALFNAIYRRLMSLSALVNDSGPARQCLSSGFGARNRGYSISRVEATAWGRRVGDLRGDGRQMPRMAVDGKMQSCDSRLARSCPCRVFF